MIRKYHGHLPVDVPIPIHHHVGMNWQHIQALTPWVSGLAIILGVVSFIFGISMWFDFLKGYLKHAEPEGLWDFLGPDWWKYLDSVLVTVSMMLAFLLTTSLLTEMFIQILKFFFWV